MNAWKEVCDLDGGIRVAVEAARHLFAAGYTGVDWIYTQLTVVQKKIQKIALDNMEKAWYDQGDGGGGPSDKESTGQDHPTARSGGSAN